MRPSCTATPAWSTAAGADLGTTLFAALGVTAAERAEVAAGRGFDALLRRNLATGATTMLRRRCATVALPIPPGWIHDEWLAIVAAATGRTAIVDAALTDYRQHGGNQIGARRPTAGDLIAQAARAAGAAERTPARRERAAWSSACEALDGVSAGDLRAPPSRSSSTSVAGRRCRGRALARVGRRAGRPHAAATTRGSATVRRTCCGTSFSPGAPPAA